jgi:NAD(P)H dehydrogenase (quinone)
MSAAATEDDAIAMNPQTGRATVISGASGQLARRAAEYLFAAHRPERLILVTRRPDAIADLAARGAEVRFGDFAAPASLPTAFAGGGRLLLVSNTDLARRNEQHGAAIDAAAAAGIEHVVYTSIVAPEPPNPAVVAPGHYFTEQALKQSGMRWTMLRNSLYADYQVPEAQRAIAARKFVHNRAGGRIAYVARDDCAAVAAAVLIGDGYAGATFDVTGPHAFDAVELAELYSEFGALRVEPVALHDDAFIAGIVAARSNDDHARYGAELVASFGRAIREGYFASCTDTVAKLTGRPARTLREVLAEKLKPAKA